MLPRALRSVRTHERRATLTAFATLFGILASHAILETARDALFLSKIPAAHLPFVYLGIAAVSLAITQVQSRLGRRARDKRGVLSLWLVGSALVTGAFWLLLEPLGTAGLYVLYVWSGVLATLVLIHFWMLLGDAMTVTQAKRLYGIIGAGSVLGAIAGTAIASALARVTSAENLLLASAGLLLATALLPMRLAASPSAAGPGAAKNKRESGLLNDLRYVLGRPYARSVASLVLVSTLALTLADYVFKTVVADTIAPENLGAFLATFYLILNVVSLVVQLLLVGWAVRRFTLVGALTALPLFVTLGGGGLIFLAALPAALLIKGADGSLRYSLHKTASELLFVPLSERARDRVKSFIDVACQRGGQAIASVGILVATAIGVGVEAMGVLVVLLGLAWLWTTVRVRAPYLDLFRRQLRHNRLALGAFPDLDLSSFETLIAGLDSQNDTEVLVALQVLDAEGRARLIPRLILYHPADEVVIKALQIFARDGRKDAVKTIDRLLDHQSERVRAAAVAARAVLQPDPRWMRAQLLDDAARVRAAVMINLIAIGEIVGSDAKDNLESLIKSGRTEARVTLADAIGFHRKAELSHVLVRLIAQRDAEVQLAAARAMARIGDPELLQHVVPLLADDLTRRATLAVLRDFGPRSVDVLATFLANRDADSRLRWHVPRALAELADQPAADAMLPVLPDELDGMVAYRIIRSLERIVARSDDPIALDGALLDRVVERGVADCYRLLDRRIALQRGAEEAPERRTPGHELLVSILEGKFENALDRLFRTLGLRLRSEDMGDILRGLRDEDETRRASSLELLENILVAPLKPAILGLVDDTPDRARLAFAGHYFQPERLDYEAVLARALEADSRTLKSAALFHIGELGLGRFAARLEGLDPEPLIADDLELARERLAAVAS